MLHRARFFPVLLAGAASLLLALAGGAATVAALHYEQAEHGLVVLAGTAYALGLVLLLVAGLVMDEGSAFRAVIPNGHPCACGAWPEA
ncbi:hypothetical protein [Kitasatospora sp. NPDC057541]|uniref:hypothetical protein n=1 Tax=unclassified Kitasatospora TaxID=2633591 RepID=UPI0036A3A30D